MIELACNYDDEISAWVSSKLGISTKGKTIAVMQGGRILAAFLYKAVPSCPHAMDVTAVADY